MKASTISERELQEQILELAKLTGWLGRRFVDKVAPSPDGCLLWTGFVDKAGYGRLRLGGRMTPVGYAHRIAWEALNGPIPPGREIDHLCRVRECVNPDHLEAVEHVMNVRRGAAAFVIQTGRCKRGHEREIHGYARKDRPGRFNCRECRRQRRREDAARTGA